jgi:hypothetical protein
MARFERMWRHAIAGLARLTHPREDPHAVRDNTFTRTPGFMGTPHWLESSGRRAEDCRFNRPAPSASHRSAARMVVFAAMAAASCGGSAKMSETHVARNEPFHTGNVDYDDFFEDVSTLRTSSANAVEEEKKARAPLAQALGVGDAPVDKLLDTFRSKAEELANGKSHIHFFFVGLDDQGHAIAGKRISFVPISAAKQAIPPDAPRIASAMEQSAQRESQVWETYSLVPEKGHRLEAKAGTLRSSVATDFPQMSKGKRDEVERELAAAQQLSQQMAQEGEQVVSTSLRFLKESFQIAVAAATTDTKAPPPPAQRITKSKTLRGDHAAPDRGAQRPAPPAPAAAPVPPPAERPPARATKPKEPPLKKRAAPAAPPAEPAPKAPDFNP